MVDYVEPKPGIHRLLRAMFTGMIETINHRVRSACCWRATSVRARSTRSPNERGRVRDGAARPWMASGPDDYFSLVDLWIDGLYDAFAD